MTDQPKPKDGKFKWQIAEPTPRVYLAPFATLATTETYRDMAEFAAKWMAANLRGPESCSVLYVGLGVETEATK